MARTYATADASLATASNLTLASSLPLVLNEPLVGCTSRVQSGDLPHNPFCQLFGNYFTYCHCHRWQLTLSCNVGEIPLCTVQPDFQTWDQTPENADFSWPKNDRKAYDGNSMNRKEKSSGGESGIRIAGPDSKCVSY